jgi:hypothetical protein
MLFKPEHIEQIRTGEKTVTRLDWKRRQVTDGGVYIASTEMFTSHDEADCYIRVTDVYEEPLGALSPAQADREGGYTVEEFEDVWREINGEYDAAKRVTVVEFEYVGRTHPD